ncbi:MAG: Gfo/Idh/MocA family oxidoreductase [Ignavibacteriae bacterium]|nr:Gfo/Idh/MocA family oxidoreductase [Ignavibacteriota bacterium]MCB9208815.1 Gfo/Idh/MocA family oxidoreductase [Ignavibacteriales bacterium]MCB9218267.1 Gfo/Idh/MocA family oxidoreductase [Ignavibacteriales bacterium]MCB9260562.1 Gfo/Idh/MocA family oxidoreductase [Ignavibacteriales bacterium]
MSEKESKNSMSRRKFIGNVTLASAAFTIVPRNVLGGKGYTAPSDKLNIAVIGVGGKGRSDMWSCSSENIVALCDVDDRKMEETLKKTKEEEGKQELAEKLEKAPKYKDFREMLDKQKDIDAVTVSTPDHTHAVAAAYAMRRGKHAFVQKPLTHSVKEARILNQIAKETGVITQMGNQGHAQEGIRLIAEWLADGAIGEVNKVDCWTNRPVWDTGMDRPEEIPSVPRDVDWNLWLGPAEFRPYHPAYMPWSWRAWCDFGTGALGDMGAHIFDIPYETLKLGYPTSIEASSSKFNEESWPVAEVFHYKFPKRGNLPAVELGWYDGGIMPPRPEELEPGRRMGDEDGGVLFYGTKGKIMCGCYGSSPRLIPETKMKEYKQPEKTIPRSPGIHEEWIACIKENKQATSNFDYASKLVETMMLGNIAIRMAPKFDKLEWDGEKGEITNIPEANEFLIRKYPAGWEL